MEEVNHFTYLGNIIDTNGGTETDVKAKIGKASVAFLQLTTIWNHKVLSLKIKFRICNTNVKAVLLYGAETWKSTKRIHTFVNSYLRRILGIWWPEIISNEQLWQGTCQIPVKEEIQQRRW